MRTGFERHVEGRALRGLPRLLERDRLAMRPSARRRDAPTDDNSIPHQNRANGGIGGGEAERPLAEIQRSLHPSPVFIVAQVGRAHRAGASSGRCAFSGSASPPLSSSPTIVLKSRASRKFLYTDAKRT